jgi:signal transduction histidine kinase
VYLQLNKIDSAKYYLTEALDKAKEYKFMPKIRIILNDWCNYYSKNKQFDKAYEYRTWLNSFTDSLITIQNHNRILLYDARYQSDKKELHIKQLEQEKKIQQLSLRQQSIFNYVLLGSLAALLVIAFLGWRYVRSKQKISQQTGQLQAQRIRELEQEKQLIAFDFLLKGQEEERSRLAKDLHDGLGGMLSGVKLSLSAMKGNVILSEENARLFTKALSQLDNSMREMRRVAHNMMPEALVKFGLQQAVQDYCDSLLGMQQFKISCHFHDLDKRIEPTAEIIVYRIVQELLNNVVKHAGATEVLVQVMRHNNSLNITVEDNGKGFDLATLDQSKGAGLANVKSRVDYLKGQLDIRSEPGKGTSVHIDCNLTEV